MLIFLQEYFDEAKEMKEEEVGKAFFDRESKSSFQKCDTEGILRCVGPYGDENCKEGHILNPYDSKQSRQELARWDLDHIIEVKEIGKYIFDYCERNGVEAIGDGAFPFFMLDLLFGDNLQVCHRTCHLLGHGHRAPPRPLPDIRNYRKIKVISTE